MSASYIKITPSNIGGHYHPSHVGLRGLTVIRGVCVDPVVAEHDLAHLPAVQAPSVHGSVVLNYVVHSDLVFQRQAATM